MRYMHDGVGDYSISVDVCFSFFHRGEEFEKHRSLGRGGREIARSNEECRISGTLNDSKGTGLSIGDVVGGKDFCASFIAMNHINHVHG